MSRAKAFADLPIDENVGLIDFQDWQWVDRQLPACGGWLKGMKFDTRGCTLDQVDFMDINGSPIIMLSGKSLELIGNTVSFELDPSGMGALPDMNSHCRYRLRVRGKGLLQYTLITRPLGDVPTVMPPAMGTLGYWTNIRANIIRPGYNVVNLSRVGNEIDTLMLYTLDYDGDLLNLPVEPALRWDYRIMEEHFEELEPGVFKHPNPRFETLPSTLLAAHVTSDHNGTVNWIVHDISRPFPAP